VHSFEFQTFGLLWIIRTIDANSCRPSFAPQFIVRARLICSAGKKPRAPKVLRALGESKPFRADVFPVSIHLELVSVSRDYHSQLMRAVFSAGGKIGESLKFEELSGRIFGLENDFVGAFHNGIVKLFRNVRTLALVDLVEFHNGELFAVDDLPVDLLDDVPFVVEGLEGPVGSKLVVESFGTRLGDTFTNGVIGIVKKPFCDLVDFVVGEAIQGALFSHKSIAKNAKSTGYVCKM
jgi:hypothetical protein